MPAAEQTWRDTQLLHKLFGVSSFVVLVATIWMYAADHNREWKPIQHAANRIDSTMADWRQLQFQTESAVRQQAELTSRLQAAQAEAIPAPLLDAFIAEVHGWEKTKDLSFDQLRALAGEIEAAGAPVAGAGDAAEASAVRQARAAALRTQVVDGLRAIIAQARFDEDQLLRNRKATSADRDAAVATHGILIRDGRPQGELDAQQATIDRLTRQLAELTGDYQKTKEHRVRLDTIVKQMTQSQDAAQDALTKSQAELTQLREGNRQRTSSYLNWVSLGYGISVPMPGKRFLELPILDAFNSPLKIDNNWSNGNEINYNFTNVRRFDRCTTCHRSMQKTLPGSAVDPAYENAFALDFRLALPKQEEEPAAEGDAPKSNSSATTGGTDPLQNAVGLQLADEGLLRTNDATVRFIVPGSIAAQARPVLNETVGAQPGDQLRKAWLQNGAGYQHAPARPGLLVGDVVAAVNGDPVLDPAKASSQILDALASKREVVVTIRRGLENPFGTHPRLDLHVGSLSPHKMSEFACTICHEGQGSATAFKFASHTPNTERQRKNWVRDHGWFDNAHWIYPMAPERFVESTCLKCHPSVIELQPSERFPEAPAPKLVHGFHLISKYGCFGCHEINGFDGKKRVGPDLRLEPNVFAAAQQLQSDPGFAKLTSDEKKRVAQLVDHPESTAVRHQVLEMLETDASAETPRLSAEVHARLTPLFRDVESPGALRKPGPSLRFAGAKVEAAFLYDWIREPKHFRPTSRMPQFFGLHKHLQGAPGLKDAQAFEPLEILGLSTYLLERSQNFAYLEPPAGVTEQADAGRGKIQFQTRGCLACHNHGAFPDAQAYREPNDIVQGPDLSGLGAKLAAENGRKWLYSWIKEPTRYHARTVMPNLFLDPIKVQGAPGEPTKVTDPAADIVAFLLADTGSWKPAAGTLTKPQEADAAELDRFVTLNLAEAFAAHRAAVFTKKGIPESLRGELKGAELELLVPDSQHQDAGFELTTAQKLRYIGNKTIAKYGCYGCHDIPGFEDAKPIGTGLADWGRKDSAKLAFEHISHYLEHGHGHSAPGHNSSEAASAVSNAGHETATAAGKDGESPEDLDYYISLVKSANRAGFLWQKLLEPRSYDFQKTENKKYSERLRMPQFPFDAAEREAIVTFVLGLVAEPPTPLFTYRPSERQAALLAGRQVLEKYNCAGCHMLAPERWDLNAEPGQFGEQSKGKVFPFVQAHFTPPQVADSSKTDSSGLVRATLRGIPSVDDQGISIAYDDAGDPVEGDGTYDPAKLEWSLDLWQAALIEGKSFDVGVLPINVPVRSLQRRLPSDGGFLAKYLLPHVVTLEKQVNPAAKGAEAWGWLPPPLVGEGAKVQTDWLHSFLLNPYPIRPATYLRMPRFNMSSAEATLLVNYFAAVDGVEYPYSFAADRQPEHLRAAESAYQQATKGQQVDGKPRTRFDDAMRLIVNNNYCVKCHLVADFEPTGADRAKAPNLALIHKRLRPDYLRTWIANPKTYLPYTSMPVNIPYDPDLPNQGGVAQDLFHGTSIEQVDGLVDLLMNFDEYAKQKSSVNDLVKKFGGAAPPAGTGGAAGGEE